MVSSCRYQPANTASHAVPRSGGSASMPASSSTSVIPLTPSTITRRCPRRRNTSTADDAGVSTPPGGTGRPAACSASAHCAGVFTVPLVNTQNGMPRSTSVVRNSSAPGSTARPLLLRSPSTSVPSMSSTNPRTAPSSGRVLRPDSAPRSAPRSFLAAMLPELSSGTAHRQREPGLGHRQVVHRPPRPQLLQQRQHRRQRRVVVLGGRTCGHHRVHLLGRHVRPQQQLLVGDPREPPPQLGGVR